MNMHSWWLKSCKHILSKSFRICRFYSTFQPTKNMNLIFSQMFPPKTVIRTYMYRYIYVSAKHASSLGGMLPRPIQQQPWLSPACKTPWSFFGLPESRIARCLSTEFWCATKSCFYRWKKYVMLMVGSELRRGKSHRLDGAFKTL